MTPQEQDMLDGLIGRVQATQLAGKDPAAENRIQAALGHNPDALYILCQTVLVQGYALDQATAQLQSAQQQLAQAQANAGNHPGFLEKIFGSSQPQQPPAPTNAPRPTGYGGPVYTATGYPAQSTSQPGYPQPGYPQQAYPPQQGGFGGGGFLQGALQTAAGVAMGEIAVQSIEGLVRGFGREAGYGSDRALGGFGDNSSRDLADNTGSDGDSFGNRLRDADSAGPGLSADIEDRRGDSQSFFGSADNDNSGSSFFGGGNDDTAQDNSFSDYSSSNDDSGGNDDNSF